WNEDENLPDIAENDAEAVSPPGARAATPAASGPPMGEVPPVTGIEAIARPLSTSDHAAAMACARSPSNTSSPSGRWDAWLNTGASWVWMLLLMVPAVGLAIIKLSTSGSWRVLLRRAHGVLR